MKRKRFSVEQIVALLKQAEAGTRVVELIRQVGITEQTFYRWEKHYAALQTDRVRQLKPLTQHRFTFRDYAVEARLPSRRRRRPVTSSLPFRQTRT